MKKDKEKKKKRLKRASPSPAPVEVVSAGESVQLAAPEAPLVYFLRVAGGKWKTRILWALQDGKCHRYGEIKSAVSGITDMMLSQSLRELTECGLTIRRQFQEIPPRVEYEITAAGRELLPIFEKIVEWEKTFRPLLEEQKKASAESGND